MKLLLMLAMGEPYSWIDLRMLPFPLIFDQSWAGAIACR
jgi:hypothetical protein